MSRYLSLAITRDALMTDFQGGLENIDCMCSPLNGTYIPRYIHTYMPVWDIQPVAAVCAGGRGGLRFSPWRDHPASGDATRPRPTQSVPRPSRSEAIRLRRAHTCPIDDGPVVGLINRPILYILSGRCSFYPPYPVQCAANTCSFSHHSTLRFSPETSLLLCPSNEHHRHRSYQAACACSGSSSSDRGPIRSNGLACGLDRYLDRRGGYTNTTNCHTGAVRAFRLLTHPGAPGAPGERGEASYEVHRKAC